MEDNNLKDHSENTNDDGITVQQFRHALNNAAADRHDTKHGGHDAPPLTREHQKTEPRPADTIHSTNYADREVPVRQLYAIIDSVTNSIIGGIQLHMNNQSAIRTLYDIATADTMVNKHPLDFDLWLLGALGNDHRLNNNLTRIVSGAQIETMVKASNEAKQKEK